MNVLCWAAWAAIFFAAASFSWSFVIVLRM